MSSGLLAGIRWSVCMLKSHRSLCESFSRTGAGLCIFHFFSFLLLFFLLLFLYIYIFYYYFFFLIFYHQLTLMVFHKSFSESKSPQVSRTLLSILAVFNYAVVWMVSSRPPTSKSCSSFSNPLVTVPKAPITIGIIVTCRFFFFQFLSKVEVLILLFTFFQFYSVVSRDSQVDNLAISLFLLLIIIRSGLLAKIGWSVCMSKPHRSLCVLFTTTGAGLYIYHLLVWSNFNFLHISLCIILPTPLCLVFYSFCANLLHSPYYMIPGFISFTAYYYYYYYYYYYLFIRVFTSALADGLSLEFEWQQVSPSLQDSSQYFVRSQ